MVRSKIKMKIKNRKHNQISSNNNKQEIKSLLNKLNSVVPCKTKGRLKSTDVVFKAVQHINRLHKKIAEEKGVEALHHVQKNARIKALKKFKAMNTETRMLPEVSKRQLILKHYCKKCIHRIFKNNFKQDFFT